MSEEKDVWSWDGAIPLVISPNPEEQARIDAIQAGLYVTLVELVKYQGISEKEWNTNVKSKI